MSLRKELKLKWHGKDYKLLVTMAVIDRIEDGINIGRLLAQHATGDMRFSHIAKFLSLVLNEAGAKTTQESIYEDLFSGEEIAPEQITAFMSNIFSVFFPEPKKKDVSTPKPKARKKSKTSTGKKSTS